MAVITPLASPINVKGVSKTLTGAKKSLNQTNNSFKEISSILVKKTKVRNKLFRDKLELTRRREIAASRKEEEDRLEAPNIVKTGGPPQVLPLVQSSGRSFFGRILSTLGYLAAGWVLRNLPTWVALGTEFVARIGRAGEIIKDFVSNTISVFTSTFQVLESFKSNLMNFDLFDSSNKVKDSFDELKTSIDNMGIELENAIKLVTTPLTQTTAEGTQEGTYSGADVPGLGTTSQDMGAYEEKYSGSGVSGELLSTNAKTTYYDPALGGINASGAKTKEGLPATSTGEGYKSNVFSAAAFPPLLAKLPKSMTVPAQGFPGGRTLKTPFNVIVTNSQGKKAVIRVNDVGPGVEGHSPNHMLDLSVAAKNYLGTGGGFTIEMAQPGAKPGPIDSVSGNEPQKAISTPSTTLSGGEYFKPLPQGSFKGGAGQTFGASREGRKHLGLDITESNWKPGSDPRIPVVAIRGGTVISVVPGSQYLSDAVIQQDDGYEVRYLHMSPSVKKGQKVSAGQQIGRLVPLEGRGVGMPGSNTHLHLEMRKGSQIIDPTSYIKSIESGAKPKTQITPAPTQQPPQPAQIAGTPQQPQIQGRPQALTPERRGQDIFAVMPQQQAAPTPQSIPSSPSGGTGGAPSMSDVLNNFMKQKLLLDLAYV